MDVYRRLNVVKRGKDRKKFPFMLILIAAFDAADLINWCNQSSKSALSFDLDFKWNVKRGMFANWLTEFDVRV